MPNTKAAKKAVRSSKAKQTHNLYWKAKYKLALKELKKALDVKASDTVLQEKFKVLQKALDKASKEKVIHKNKASRVKSRYAKKATVQTEPKAAKKAKAKTSKSK